MRELRPVFASPRTFQRTHHESGGLVQFDLWEPSEPIAVGHGQTRHGWVVTSCSGYSRAVAGALIFSKEAPDVLWGMGRCLEALGALPARRSGIARVILDPGDCQAKGMLERLHDFIERSFEPARAFADELDFQDQLERCFAERANARLHRPSARSRPSGSRQSAVGCAHCPTSPAAG